MPNLGAPELIIIALVIVLLFGWKRLPDAARSLGRSARVFKSEVNEMKVEDEARKQQVGGATGPEAVPPASTPSSTSALLKDNSPRTDNQSGPIS